MNIQSTGSLLVGPSLLVSAGLLAFMIPAHAQATQLESLQIAAPGSADGPLAFVENRGQWPEEVSFRAHNGPFVTWFDSRGWTMTVQATDGKRVRGVHARLTFEACAAVRPVGANRLRATSSFFLGRDPDRWVTGAAAFDGIRYRGLYEGVDVIVRTESRRPEYDVVLAAGADLSQVVVRCDGIDGLEIEADGSLLMSSEHGPIRQTPPKTWNVLPGGGRAELECRFRKLDARRYGFEVVNPDQDLPLVIDPGFVWSTYVGGDGPDDRVYSVKRGANGRVIAAGTSNSTDFPTTLGAYSGTSSGARDAWVAVFDPTASGVMQLVASTLFGGADDDWCYHIEFDAARNKLTLSGNTLSTDFPVTKKAWQKVHAGGYDGYYLEIDLRRRGTAQLRYATLIGGPGRDFVTAHKVSGERVVMTGEAADGFPVTPGAFQTTHGGGGSDAFVATLQPNRSKGSQLLSSTYLGGMGADGNRLDFVDQGVDLDIDERGAAVVAGRTASTDFPTTPTALQATLGGTQDGFVARLNKDNTALVYSSFVGGSGSDAFSQVHYGGCGVVTAAGYAGGADFPVSSNAFQPLFAGGNSDIAVVRIDTGRSGAAGLIYGTYLGGDASAPVTSTERTRGMAVEPSGSIVIGGFVGTTGFPTTPGAMSRTFGGGPVDAVIARIDPRQKPARQLLYSSYVPGNGADAGLGLDLDGRGGSLIGGITGSSDFLLTPGAFDNTLSVGLDGFVSRIDLLPAGVRSVGEPTSSCAGDPYAGVTNQPRGSQPEFGVFNNLAPWRGAGLLLIGPEAAGGFPVANARLYVDVSRCFKVVPVRADRNGFVQIDMKSSQLPAATVTVQFLWFNALRCRGRGLLGASNALSY